jgi:hypothetical protein
VFYVGISIFAERVARWVFEPPIVRGLTGVGILLFAAWALGRMITRGSTLGFPFARFS